MSQMTISTTDVMQSLIKMRLASRIFPIAKEN